MAKISDLPLLINPAGNELVPAVSGEETVGVRIDALVAAALPITVADDGDLFGLGYGYECDAYGCVLGLRTDTGAQHLLGLSVAGRMMADDRNLFGPSISYECDAYGCVTQRVDQAGTLHVLQIDAKSSAASSAAIVEPSARDNVLRYTPGGWLMIPVFGESTSVGLPSQGAQVSTFQPYSNLTGEYGPATAPGGMGTLRALYEVKPEYTASPTETPCSGFANMLSEYAFKHYGVVPADMPIITGSFGQGGQTVAQLAKGGSSARYDDWLLPAIANVKAQAAAAGKPLVVPAVVFICGANDGAAGTSYATMKAGLLKLAADFDADVRAITGQTQPCAMLLYQTSGCFERTSIKPILQAQFDAQRESPLIEYAGNWQDGEFWDGVHQTTRGTLRMAAKEGVMGAQYLFEGRVRGGRPLAAWAQAGAVSVRFDCPMTIDVDNMGAVQDFGIAITDDAGVVPIATVSVDGAVVTIDPARPLQGSATFELARTYQAANTTSGGCATNLRAIYADTFTYGGIAYPLFRWGAHALLPIITTEH
jgi:hypothetical protein